MFKKIVMFLACALIGIAALTPAQAAGQDTQKKEVEVCNYNLSYYITKIADILKWKEKSSF